MARKAVWKKRGKPDLHGSYEYCWAGGFFTLWLDSTDPVTGRQRVFRTYDDDVSFNGYKLVKERATAPAQSQPEGQ